MLEALSKVFNGNAVEVRRQFSLNLCDVSRLPTLQILLHLWEQTKAQGAWSGAPPPLLHTHTHTHTHTCTQREHTHMHAACAHTHTHTHARSVRTHTHTARAHTHAHTHVPMRTLSLSLYLSVCIKNNCRGFNNLSYTIHL